MSTVNFWLLAVAACAIPVVVVVILARRYQISNFQTISCLLIGAAGWGLIARMLKTAVTTSILAMKHLSLTDANVLVLISSDSGFLLLFAAIAGIFEELCKPLLLLLVMRQQVSRRNAVAIGWIVGAGAGLLESVVFVVQSVSSPSPGGELDITVPVERMLTTFFHAGTSAFVVAFVRDRRFILGLSVPIVLHTTLDFVGPYAALHQAPKWLVLATLALFSLFAIILAVLASRRDGGNITRL